MTADKNTALDRARKIINDISRPKQERVEAYIYISKKTFRAYGPYGCVKIDLTKLIKK